MDKKLFGGFNRGELNIFAGGSGAGKSLFLANIGVNMAEKGMNVLYLTLELAESLVSMRIDSMLTGIGTRDIFKQIEDVELKVKMIGKKSGALQVKYMPSGKTANDIRSYIKEYEIKTGKKVDVLLIDYLDLLMPASMKVSAENLFIKDKYVSEELRNLAMELQCVFVTAAQLNRGAVEEIEFDHSHISGGLSKIQTADNVFGIFTSRAMRERGRYQLQLMKTRNSSGVGQKIDLGFDVNTLRIIDCDDDDDDGYNTPGSGSTSSAGASVIAGLKRSSTTNAENPAEGASLGKVRGETDSTKLKQFLNNLGTDD
jgi:replicative DNA helicase